MKEGGRSHSQNERNKDMFASYHFKNKRNLHPSNDDNVEMGEDFNAMSNRHGDYLDRGNFALDDMTKPFTLDNQNKRSHKRTRSMS